MPGPLLKKKWQVFSVTLCTLSAFLLLFIFRNADDNRLTSWKWAFTGTGAGWAVLIILPGLILIYALLNSPITRQRPSLFLFFISFAICAIFWRVPEVIIDASRYFTQAKHLELYGIKYFFSEWGKDINVWTDLPLIPFLYGLVFKIFGEARAFIQVFTAILFAGTAVFTYLIGRSLWNEDTGFRAGVLLWGIPYIFSQTPLMLVDVPTMFFLTSSIYLFIMALQRGGIWIFVSAISVFCAVFSKYSAWVMLSVLAVVFLVYLKQGAGFRGQGSEGCARGLRPVVRNYIYRGVLAVFIAGVLIVPLVLYKYEVVLEQMKFLREYQSPGLRRWGESFASTFLYQIHPFITVAALYSVYEAFRKKDLKFLIISWLVLLTVLLQIRRSRYVMVVFPMFTLMASYGLQKIESREIRRYVLSCIVTVSLAVAMFAYLPLLQSMSLVNLKNAGSFLDSVDAEEVEVFTVPSAKSTVNSSVAVPLLDLYTEKDIRYPDADNFSLPYEKIKTSPIRFTWEYKNPGYYTRPQKGPVGYPAIAVISNLEDNVLPESIEEKVKGYRKVRVFEKTDGLFLYSPVVTVYMPATESR
jgi:hypothetical protein